MSRIFIDFGPEGMGPANALYEIVIILMRVES